jgi:cell division protein FtsN
VHLASSDEKPLAERYRDRAREAGIAADISPAQMGGKTWYRVTVQGFATPEQARAYVANEARKAGFGAAWIAKR